MGNRLPTLYLVATPIGNLEDVTFRSLRILKEVALIAAEDTRKTKRLLARYDIRTPLTSYYEHNKLTKLDAILAALEKGDVAVVSEAGMPGISDPGYELVCAALARGIRVVPVPGASAPATALTASGLPTDRFLYVGFLPRRAVDRSRMLASLAAFPSTIVAFEAPHRLLDALHDIAAAFGPARRMVVARELTKLHEEIVRGTVDEVLEHFRASPPRGEITLVIAGAPAEGPRLLPDDSSVQTPASATEPAERLRQLLAEGVSRSQAVRRVVQETGLPRREVYRQALTVDQAARPPDVTDPQHRQPADPIHDEGRCF